MNRKYYHDQLDALLARARALHERLNAPKRPDPLAWSENAAPFGLEDFQRALIRDDTARVLLLCSRQTGKTEGASLKASSFATCHAASETIVVSPSYRQSLNAFERISGYLSRSGDLSRMVRDELNLSNGSRVRCLPGDQPDKLRGISAVDLCLLDEASFARESLIASVILPMLSQSRFPVLGAKGEDLGGRLIAMTTPSGPGNWFARQWLGDDTAWSRIKVLASDLPHRFPEHKLQEIRDRLGDWRFRQEFLCEFVSPGGAFLNPELLERMFDPPTPEVPDMIEALFQ